jgi:hypothetical protein
MTKSTRGDWRLLVTVGMTVLLASVVGVAPETGRTRMRVGKRRVGRGGAALLALVVAAALGVAAPSNAGRIPGGGTAKSDCYAELEVTGIENPSQRVQNNKIVLCTDGEACDTGPCGDNQCDVQVSLCINQTDPNVASCTPPAGLDGVKVKAQGKVKLNVQVPQLLQGPSCGPNLDGTIPVKLDKQGQPKGAGKAKLKVTAKAAKGTKPRTDDDQFTIKCVPRTVACPASTTTTSTTPTTSTTSTTATTIPGAGSAVQVSAPPNGTHFVPGDAPSVTVVLNDDAGNPLTLEQLSTANLYMYGPQDQSRTTTAVALLRASTDRNARPHHYIDLKTNPDVVADGNVITYPLNAVTDELPGTYTVTVWAVLAADGLQQWMPAADCQIGTPDAETQIVEKDECGACHLGAKSGKFYLHHIDPGFSPAGNWALDSWPVRTCKSCHNQDGYAGYNNGTGGTDANTNRTTDPIVRRVHGVHMGADLKAPFNIDPDTGDFKDYIEVEFPADVRNCTSAMWTTGGRPSPRGRRAERATTTSGSATRARRRRDGRITLAARRPMTPRARLAIRRMPAA